MSYSFQVAYLNTLRVKKVIPQTILQEIISNKNLSMLVSTLKDYHYRKIFDLKNLEVDILDASKFEEIINQELDDTLDTIENLLKEKDKYVIGLLRYFNDSNTKQSYDELFQFFKKYTIQFKNLNSNLCVQLLKLIVDFENIKLFLLYMFTKATDVKFLPYGNIKHYMLKEIFPSIESLNKIVSVIYYSPEIKLSIELQQKNFNYYFTYYLQQISWKSKFCYFTIEPIIFYFFEKLFEAHYLKQAYYSIKGLF